MDIVKESVASNIFISSVFLTEFGATEFAISNTSLVLLPPLSEPIFSQTSSLKYELFCNRPASFSLKYDW